MILLNVPEVRDYFIINNIVYSLRKPRRTGDDIAYEGNWRKPETLKKIADVTIDLIIENVTNLSQLILYVPYSGLQKKEETTMETAIRWLELAQKLSGKKLNLYKITKQKTFREWFEDWEKHAKSQDLLGTK